MNQTTASIRAVILDGLHQIAPEADLGALTDEIEFRRELEIDSFDFLRLLIFVHDRLDVEFPEAEYGRLTTVAKLVNYIEAKLLSSKQTNSGA